MDDRSIIHLNVADFAVAVESAVDVRLRDRPVIVAPEGAPRAVVYDMSEKAYQAGVRKQMALRRALRRCPDAEVLAPHPARYERAMARLLKHALPFSPLVEMTDHNGHLFIDATGTGRLFGAAADVAWRIRRQVKADMGIDPIWSVATNKLVAKVATRMVKPTGEYIVRAGDEPALLHPLPVFLIPGIDADDVYRLHDFNLRYAGEVRRLSAAQLSAVFGSRSQALYEAVRGIDHSPVLPAGARPPAIRLEHALGNDTNDRRRLSGMLYGLVESAGRRLRRQQMAAGRLCIDIDYSDGVRITRQRRLRPATANDIRLFAAAEEVLKTAWVRRVRVRHLRLTCDGLCFPPAQQALFADERRQEQRTDRLVTALDAVRDRYGHAALVVGRTLSARGDEP